MPQFVKMPADLDHFPDSSTRWNFQLKGLIQKNTEKLDMITSGYFLRPDFETIGSVIFFTAE